MNTKIKIISKKDASKVKQLFPHLVCMKYDGGKYKWSGTSSEYIGREINKTSSVKAVWVERRQDSDGPYAQLMCYTELN